MAAAGSVSVTSKVEKAGYRPWWNAMDLKVFGVSAVPKEVREGEQIAADWKYEEADQAVIIHIKEANRDWTATVQF
jgi:hypothetical protein